MFGLFESVESKGTKAGIAAVQPMLGGLQAFGGPGIPPGLWQDPYVLGYLNMTVNMWAKLHTNGKAEGGTLGLVLMNVYAAVSHQNAPAIVSLTVELMQAQQPDFVRGMEDGMLIFLYGQNRLKQEIHPTLLQAKADAAAMGKPNDKVAISGLMLMATWYKEVKRVAKVQ